ncbi:hypothetical protein [Brevibacillus parabrevis]|uniref:hypothetical protein n=1 Tax=Brevibacillus parabrevis TaxID=54914 RepID=UPI001134027C|nr:hypothetical protein [Brevibacillus parabrevis]TGV29235.1 hypothetical protein EN829_041005 [Mesorhizobium sp. M00.F.Ca.ET.186.01.1.1]
MIGFVTVLVVGALHRRYPQKTIIQYSEHIIGIWGIPNMIVFNYLDETSLPYYGFFMQILLPLLLLLIAKLRNKPQRMKSAA